MSINFSKFNNNVSSWVKREYGKYEKDLQEKKFAEYDGLIKKELLTVNNYAQSVIDEIQFEVRSDLKNKFDYTEARELYEEYQGMTKPYKFSAMEYKAANPKKESVFERVEQREGTSSKGPRKSTQEKNEQNVIVGASVGGLLGASFGFKAASPVMLKIITISTGLLFGAIIGGYITRQLQTKTMKKSPATQTYQETASTVQSEETIPSFDAVLRQRRQQVEHKLHEIVDQMARNYDKLLASENK
ncbi:MAG: hypothetical protein FH756_05095 [Firmicutes bacterium]|nr:hypothetical protein [Bacillota bacterium]